MYCLHIDIDVPSCAASLHCSNYVWHFLCGEVVNKFQMHKVIVTQVHRITSRFWTFFYTCEVVITGQLPILKCTKKQKQNFKRIEINFIARFLIEKRSFGFSVVSSIELHRLDFGHKFINFTGTRRTVGTD